MLGWFRKKEIAKAASEADSVLALSDTGLADLCSRIICNEDDGPEGNAMVVVAYANMQIMFRKTIYVIESRKSLDLDLTSLAVDGRLEIFPHVEERPDGQLRAGEGDASARARDSIYRFWALKVPPG